MHYMNVKFPNLKSILSFSDSDSAASESSDPQSNSCCSKYEKLTILENFGVLSMLK